MQSFPPVCRDVRVLSLQSQPDDGQSSGLFVLRLQTPGWAGWRPGQFVMIRPDRACGGDVLWARPFSISQADNESLTIVFQVAGRATRAYLDLEAGDTVTVWGPLGNHFAVEPARPTLLLAGGIGIAPFVGYIQSHPAPETLRLEFGHRLPVDCYPFDQCLPPLTQGRGRSHRERCSEDLAAFLRVLEDGIAQTGREDGLVLACGPMPFLKSVREFALRHGTRAQLSLETRMACGVGACLGCVVKAIEPDRETPVIPAAFDYVQTCTRGPVFWADRLSLD